MSRQPGQTGTFTRRQNARRIALGLGEAAIELGFGVALGVADIAVAGLAPDRWWSATLLAAFIASIALIVLAVRATDRIAGRGRRRG